MDRDLDFNKATRRILFSEAASPQPEKSIPGAGTSAARRPERHARVKVTMNVDGDIVAFFKERAKADGRPYQSLMNQALRDHVSGNRVERIAGEVAVELLEDENFLAAVAEKLNGK